MKGYFIWEDGMPWDVVVALNFSTDADSTKAFPDGNRVLGTLIAQHQGKELGTFEDTKFVEFENAVAAVRCALALQNALAAQTRGADPNGQVSCRISINHRPFGADQELPGRDEIEDTFKLLSVADPHGISMARTVFDKIKSRLLLEYDTSRPIEQCGYLCQNIRGNLGILDLLVLSAVRIPPSVIQAAPPAP